MIIGFEKWESVMADKEIRKLTRAELIEIIYQLQINQE